MKIALCLIVAVGVWFAGWHPEQLHALSTHISMLTAPTEPAAPAVEAVPVVLQQPKPASPHPAREAQAKAMEIYPGLARPDSALNQKFLALYQEAKASNPELLTQPDWPLQLADQAMVALGATPYSGNTATLASLGNIPTLSSLTGFGNTALNAPASPAGRVNSNWYYWPRYYYGYSSYTTTTAPKSSVGSSFSNRPSTCIGSSTQANWSVYRSRLETCARSSSTGTARCGTTNAPRTSTTTFGGRITTVSVPRSSSPRSSAASRSAGSTVSTRSIGNGIRVVSSK